MSAAAGTQRKQPGMPGMLDGLVVRQFARAAAERGRLDPVFQELSEHYSQMMQKLYPVWVLIGPGLSDPAHIEVHSRTVWMDSTALLGEKATIVRGDLDAFRILISIGVAAHEAFHGAHTKRWIVERNVELAASDDEDDRQLAVDRRLIEEPRMEATGVRDYSIASSRGRFLRRALRAATADILVPSFMRDIAGQLLAGQPVTRDLCGRAMTYLHARAHCETVDPATLGPLSEICEHVLGPADMATLDEFFSRLVWVDDGDQDALDRHALEYREIIGPPETPPPPQGAPAPGEGVPGIPSEPGDEQSAGGSNDSGGDGAGAAAGESDEDPQGAGQGSSGNQEPTVGSLREALEQAAEAGRQGELRQFNEEIDLRDLLDRAIGKNARENPAGGGLGTGMPTGRMPKRGVDRPAMPDEVDAIVRYVNELNKARTAGTKTIDKRSPGGRFDARAYIKGRAQRSQGQPVTRHPWEIRRVIRRPLKEPHVGLVVDTSGSMSAYEYALGPIVYILDTGLRQFGGRMATALFGNGCHLLSDGHQAMQQVPGIKTGGGTAFAGDAIEHVTDALDMTDQTRPRLLYILSDGGWYDTEAGVKRITEMRDLGVPTIHISIGPMPPLSVDADWISVINDPADALDIVAKDTVNALRTGVPRPGALQQRSAGPAGVAGRL